MELMRETGKKAVMAVEGRAGVGVEAGTGAGSLWGRLLQALWGAADRARCREGGALSCWTQIFISI